MLKLTNRRVLTILLVLAPLVWGGLLLFTYFISPRTLLPFITFFLLLGVALTCTFTPIAYVIGRRFLSAQIYSATVRYALRQGALLSLCIVLNFILRALHSWNIFMAILIVVAAIIIEVLFLAKK